MPQPDINFTPDDRLLLHTGAKTSSGAGSVAYIDLGSNPAEFIKVFLDVTAIDIASNDEIYSIVLQGSNTTAFTDSGIADLATKQLGAKETKITDCDKDDYTGRFAFGAFNIDYSAANTPVKYRYIRLYVVAAIASSSITFTAYAVPDK